MWPGGGKAQHGISEKGDETECVMASFCGCCRIFNGPSAGSFVVTG